MERRTVLAGFGICIAVMLVIALIANSFMTAKKQYAAKNDKTAKATIKASAPPPPPVIERDEERTALIAEANALVGKSTSEPEVAKPGPIASYSTPTTNTTGSKFPSFKPIPIPEPKVRTWTSTDGKKIEAAAVGCGKDYVLLRIKGKDRKVPLKRLDVQSQLQVTNNRFEILATKFDEEPDKETKAKGLLQMDPDEVIAIAGNLFVNLYNAREVDALYTVQVKDLMAAGEVVKREVTKAKQFFATTSHLKVHDNVTVYDFIYSQFARQGVIKVTSYDDLVAKSTPKGAKTTPSQGGYGGGGYGQIL